MSAISGSDCQVSVGSAKVDLIGDYSLDFGPAMLDISQFGNDWKDFLAGVREWSGSFNGSLNMTDTNGQTALVTAGLNGTSVTLKLYVSATNYFSGTAFVSKISVKSSIGGKADVSFSYTGSGTLAYT